MGNCLPSLAHESMIATVLMKSAKHRHHGTKKSTPTYGGLVKQDKHTNQMAQEKGGVIRVKILLTKKEAAQLVAKYCSESEKTMMTRVLRELDKTKSCERNTITPRYYRSSWRPALESIPEASCSVGVF